MMTRGNSQKVTGFLLLALLVSANAVNFGHEARELFMLGSNYNCLNHGSYGSTPRMVWEAAKGYEIEMESNPDLWFRYRAEPAINETMHAVGKYVNADPEDLVFIENASDGVNSILKAFTFIPGEKILLLSVVYDMVNKTATYLKDRWGVTTVMVNLSIDDMQSNEKIIQRVKDVVSQEQNIKVASIDHISSMPSLVLPVKEIIQILKSAHIPVLIDGAHAVGNIPIDIKDLKPDFYLSNFHKWLFAPKTASFLYISKEHRALVHPNIISHNYKQGIQKEFFMTGTRNYASYLAVKDALKFREIFGDAAIMKYNRDLAWNGAKRICEILGTSLMIQNPDMQTSLVMFEVPLKDNSKFDWMYQQMFMLYNTYIPLTLFTNGKVYGRISGQIFNDMSDYEFIGNVLKTLIAKSNKQTASMQKKVAKALKLPRYLRHLAMNNQTI